MYDYLDYLILKENKKRGFPLKEEENQFIYRFDYQSTCKKLKKAPISGLFLFNISVRQFLKRRNNTSSSLPSE